MFGYANVHVAPDRVPGRDRDAESGGGGDRDPNTSSGPGWRERNRLSHDLGYLSALGFCRVGRHR